MTFILSFSAANDRYSLVPFCHSSITFCVLAQRKYFPAAFLHCSNFSAVVLLSVQIITASSETTWIIFRNEIYPTNKPNNFKHSNFQNKLKPYSWQRYLINSVHLCSWWSLCFPLKSEDMSFYWSHISHHSHLLCPHKNKPEVLPKVLDSFSNQTFKLFYILSQKTGFKCSKSIRLYYYTDDYTSLLPCP